MQYIITMEPVSGLLDQSSIYISGHYYRISDVLNWIFVVDKGVYQTA